MAMPFAGGQYTGRKASGRIGAWTPLSDRAA